jgi:hypothetical protein
MALGMERGREERGAVEVLHHRLINRLLVTTRCRLRINSVKSIDMEVWELWDTIWGEGGSGHTDGCDEAMRRRAQY